jgi:hypothetical protein
MGATSWRYYTPYQEDPEQALQTLRQEVFTKGEYFDPTGPMEDVMRRTYQRLGLDPDTPELQARIATSMKIQQAVETGDMSGLNRSARGFAGRLRWISRLFGGFSRPKAKQGPHRSIDELLQVADACGTHSILDIEHVAAKSDFGVAASMKPSAVRRIFGSEQPIHDAVEENWPDAAENLDRWHARYLTVYRDGRPHEYAFIGCSGD